MRITLLVLALAALGCARRPAPAPAAEAAVRDTGRAVMRIARMTTEAFYPQGTDSAIAAFRPSAAPADSAGSCRTMRTSGSGATMITAEFHARDSSTTRVALLFDSAGNLARFVDNRGLRDLRPPPNATPAQFDSVRRENEARHRHTSITLDFPADNAMAVNNGGGKPIEAIVGTVRQLENLESLGPPNERIRRVRRFCGV